MKLIISFFIISFFFLNNLLEANSRHRCAINEELKAEGYDCQTCDNLYVKCALEKKCQCYCRPGYVRKTKDGRCIPVEDCSKAEKCDNHGILLYEDLGCTPVQNEDEPCPIKYSCQGLEASEHSCYFRGKSYINQEKIDSSLLSPACKAGCFCSAAEGKPDFVCAILDCPEWLGVPVEPGCYRKYSLDHCCSVGQICPPFDNVQKCVIDGNEYKEGEKFNPNNTCLNCVCQKGFNGKLESPFCRRISCASQLTRGEKIQQGCAPFYDKRLQEEVLCCPDAWICPDGSETIQGEAKSEEICKFGDKELKVGQQFTKLNFKDSFGRNFAEVKCECDIPPLLKCINI